MSAQPGPIGERRPADGRGWQAHDHSSAILSQWLLEELRARNAEIIEKDKVRLNLASLCLIVLGAFIGLLAQNPGVLAFEWGPVILLGIAAFFAFIGHQALYSALFSVISSNYIRDSIQPRIAVLQRDSGAQLYGWERYLWSQRQHLPVAMSALFISEGGVFALPSFAFTAYALYLLLHLHTRSVAPLAVCAVMLLFLAWLLFAAVHTAWKLIDSEKTFRARPRTRRPDRQGHV